MFCVKFLYFSAVILVAVCATENNNNDSVDTKRSAVCLIYRVAQHNHVNATFTKVNVEQRNGTPHITCKLNLGNEEYTGNSTAFAKAKERVSREAYAKTKYTKPSIHNKTCLIPELKIKNDISLLQEYATATGKFVIYEEKPQNTKGIFEYMVSLDEKSASGRSDKKKKDAKRLAATHLIEQIGRESVINTLTSKYNGTDYHSMEPTERLRKIIRVTDLSGDGLYTKLRESSERKDGKTIKRIVMQVEAGISMATGAGYTVDEARTNAAVNWLIHKGFVVNYPPKTQK